MHRKHDARRPRYRARSVHVATTMALPIHLSSLGENAAPEIGGDEFVIRYADDDMCDNDDDESMSPAGQACLICDSMQEKPTLK